MKAPDLFDLAVRNLRESVLRNSLTTLGIAVGVSSLVAMLALGVGLQEMASKRLGKSGLFDTIFVTSRQDFRDSSDNEERPNLEPEKNRALDDTARQEISRIPGVAEAHPEIRLMTEVRFNDKPHFVAVGGLPLSAAANEAFTEMKGRYFGGASAAEAIVQREFAKELDPRNPDGVIGKEVVLRYAERKPLEEDGGGPPADGFGFTIVRRELPLRIVGIIDQEPYGGIRAISRARMLIPNPLAESLNVMQASDVRTVMRSTSQGRTYLSLLVRVNDPAQVQNVQEGIKKLGFRTYSILDATRGMRRFFAVLDMFLGIFGSLALAVASIGIVNTLVMAILERRREIGIMKAIGASDADVKKLFFAEAGAMGLLGGIFGVVLGWLIGQAINFGANVWLSRNKLPPEVIWSTPWWLVAAAIGFSVMVSLVAGLYPAARAARLDPVQALRYE